jgi:hypothetical protein
LGRFALGNKRFAERNSPTCEFFVRFITILKSLSSVSTINILYPLQVAFHLLLRNASLMYDTRSTTPIAADQSADHRKPTVDAANVGHADRKTA